MLPAGKVTEEMVEQLGGLLDREYHHRWRQFYFRRQSVATSISPDGPPREPRGSVRLISINVTEVAELVSLAGARVSY
jgi:hypothetical protein